MDGVVLTVSAGNDVQGTVKLEDATEAVAIPNLNVYLRPALPIGMSPRAKAGDDLKFVLKNVSPLHYIVGVSAPLGRNPPCAVYCGVTRPPNSNPAPTRMNPAMVTTLIIANQYSKRP